VAVTVPHGPNAYDPASAVPAGANWPVRSVSRSVKSSHATDNPLGNTDPTGHYVI
jgi:hypothetical protein